MSDPDPCPLCGANGMDAPCVSQSHETMCWEVSCLCGLRMRRDYRTREEAVRGWNDRKGPTAPHMIPPHILDTFVASALKEMGKEAFVIMPENRMEYLRQIMLALVDYRQLRNMPLAQNVAALQNLGKILKQSLDNEREQLANARTEVGGLKDALEKKSLQYADIKGKWDAAASHGADRGDQ